MGEEDEEWMNRVGIGSHDGWLPLSNDDGTFPKRLEQCFHLTYEMWGLGLPTISDRGLFEWCIMDRFKISASCAKCFSEEGEYGYKECKSQCVFPRGSWCSE